MTYCSLFNGGKFLIEGNVMIHTLLQHNLQKVYLLCMDEEVYNFYSSLNHKSIVLIRREQLENKYPQIKNTQFNRSLKEYIVTFKPFLPEFIFDEFNEQKTIFLDADIAFWNDGKKMLDELNTCSFFAKDHEISPPKAAGRYNVGLLGYKNDENCREWLKWWQQKCIEWCHWHADNGRFAEQGYLNILYDQPNRFKGFCAIKHPGVNLAPWNIMKHKIENKKGLLVDNQPLMTYHYHEFEFDINGYYPTGWKLPKGAKELLYDPYFKLIQKSIKGTLF